MQDIATKIRELLKEKRYEHQELAAAVNYDHRHLSRKLSERKPWSLQKIKLAAAFFGVTPEFLKDQSIIYKAGTPIPPEYSATPPAKPTPDTDPVAALMILAQKRIDSRSLDVSKIDPELSLKVNLEMIDVMNRLAVEIRELSQELRLTREGEPGEHHHD